MYHLNKKMEKRKHNPWWWIPTLYFAEGLPYIAVNTLSVILYKKMEMSNTDIAFYTGWLYLPWVIKPFWSPFVDILRTKRWWTVISQLVIGISLAMLSFTIPTDFWLQSTLALFWLIGFTSATHDIAADGFYMTALDSSQQSFFVGIRSTFYRCATVFGQGILVIIAGMLENSLESIPKAWGITFLILSVFFLLLTVYHHLILPRPDADRNTSSSEDKNSIIRNFFGTFSSFFRKKGVWAAILFILLYRLPEAQLVKIINPFLLDSREAGGLALSTAQVGVVYGTIGIIGLTLGGILGGIIASRQGLRKCLLPMALCITLPDIVYCYLAMAQPSGENWLGMLLINTCVFIEQFGYGIGFTSFTLFMMYFARGNSQTSHFAICTAFMALGMMLPGMVAGWIQEKLGYVGFFWWAMVCCIVTILMTLTIKRNIEPDYGKKN